MVLLAYESAQPTNKELQAMFKVTERTVIRKRNVLVKKKFMEKLGSKYYVNYAIAPKALP
jgi:predicted HTH transcriptional regulator